MTSLSRKCKDDGIPLRTPMRMHLEDRDCTLTHTLKKQLGRSIIYDHIPLSLSRDRTMSLLPAHMPHHNLIVHSLNPTYIEHRLRNMLRMEGTLIQLVQIVSLSHRLNLGDHSTMFRHLPLGSADQRAGPLRCMIRLPLDPPRLYCLEGRIRYTIIHLLIPPNPNRSRKMNTIDPIGNLALHLLVPSPIEISHLQTVDRNDYHTNELLILKDGYLFLDDMILAIRPVHLEFLKRPKFNVLSKRKIPMIRPDKKIGRPSWVI
jgi:hypothetical protein